MLCGKHGRSGKHDDYLYVAMNMYWESRTFELPRLPDGRKWHVFLNTSVPSPQDIYEPGAEAPLSDPNRFVVGERSVIVLVGK